MSYSVTDIKTGISNALATIPGLRAYAQQPDNLNAPFAWPMLDSITYNGAMRGGLVTHIFVVSVVVGRSAERTAQRALDGFLSYEGTTSVRAALGLTGLWVGLCRTCWLSLLRISPRWMATMQRI